MQKKQVPAAGQRLYNSTPQISETGAWQLRAQFLINSNYAHSFRRLGARLDTTLTAHTLCIYIKHRLALHDSLQIKTLALPN